ncbi:hypothetical protein Aperf_G00000012380 [Anoplocephala perfoliata]
MPRPMGASLLDTTNPNGNGGLDVQLKSSLEDDVDFGSSREALEDHMRRQANKACSCGPDLFQNKHRASDFSFTAKRAFEEPKRFFPDPNWKGFNFAGLSVHLVVQQILLGSVGPESMHTVVHFVQGSNCGVPQEMIPDARRTYIISGRECINRFSFCGRFSAKAAVCEVSSITRVPPTEVVLKHFPPEVHGKLKKFFVSEVDDALRLCVCLKEFGARMPVDVSPTPLVTSSCPPHILLSPLIVTLQLCAFLCGHF